MAVRTRSLILLFLALGSGGLAAWLALGYLREQARPLLNVTNPATRAVIATRDIQVGAVVTENDVRVIDWPGNAVPAGMINAPENVIGRAVYFPVRLNQPFLEANLAPRGQPGVRPSGGAAVVVAPGMRALTIGVDQVAAVAGWAVNGARVDLLFTGTREGETVTKAIMQNLEILGTGQSLAVDPQGNPVQVPHITLQLTPEQAETLALAATQGRIQMTLRNFADTLPIRTNGARVSALLSGARAPAAALPPGWRRAAAAAPQPTTETTIVEGFRGGERSLTRFNRTRQPNDSTDQREPQ